MDSIKTDDIDHDLITDLLERGHRSLLDGKTGFAAKALISSSLLMV
ncbi:MAG: hypothetical protein V1758_02540 [Pseudomonadota bacterium]